MNPQIREAIDKVNGCIYNVYQSVYAFVESVDKLGKTVKEKL